MFYSNITVVLRSGERDLELGEVVQRPVHVVILQFLQWKVGLAQEYTLPHYSAVLDADLEVGTVQSSVGSLQETKNYTARGHIQTASR